MRCPCGLRDIDPESDSRIQNDLLGISADLDLEFCGAFDHIASDGLDEGFSEEGVKNSRKVTEMHKLCRWALFLGLSACIIGLAGCGENKTIREEAEVELQSNVAESRIDKFVSFGPDVQSAMLEKQYWSELNFEEEKEIIISTEQILRINEKNREMLTTDSGIKMALQDIDELIDTSFVKEMMAVYEVPEDPSTRFVNGKETTAQYWDELVKNSNENISADMVPVRFGFCVERTMVKALPTNDFIGEAADDFHYDVNVRAECPAYAPVAVFHESLDGDWYYVVCDSYGGWVCKEKIALCESRDEWILRQNPTDFLVVTGRELRLVSDPYNEESSELLLSMGTILPLVSLEYAPDDFNGRKSYGCYIVRVPIRDDKGMIADNYVLIPTSEDVSLGYLQYTVENVLDLLFKRVGDRYGWAGMYYANDCSGMVREVFACFGFHFPRSAKAQVHMSGMTYKDVSNKSEKEKMKILSDVPAGTLLYFPGHIMVYLGTVNEIPYVISAVGSWITLECEETEVVRVNLVAINSMTGTFRRNGYSWLANITDILVCE